ncbi:pitrilysin family protein [Prolixibacter sp. SD074]|jgi:predicted Zn-dependent peptidase|uniref:M16 family metallopeptidase n=1 Tax=Prolixibacter sp. SD074 TaxID=2652391 RepID=UPI00127B21D3|nr:pitrilysin family protein [Prolixibacter sp. SD074]GET29624.1 hypothetical protein SD074_18260 [Prolixibacter sp. SD074]
MINPDRNQQPDISPVGKINFLEPEKHQLSNGSSVYLMHGGEQEIVKLDFLFRAGSWYDKRKLDSVMAASMLHEGTSSRTAAQLAGTFDFYGAQFSASPYYDNSYVSLLSLKKHLPTLLPVVADIFKNSVFPDNEFEILRQKRKQKALVDSKTVGITAQRTFLRKIMGNQHPYAPINSFDLYDKATRGHAYEFYRDHYTSERMSIIASGHVDKDTLEILEESFGTPWGGSTNYAPDLSHMQLPAPEKVDIHKKGASQNAITIGRLTPTLNHPDYPALKVLLTLLGGFYGSRLMKNLREDKGYTYSVHTSPIPFLHQGIFLTFSEVGTEVSADAVKQIYHEMERLQNELVPEDELEMVRSYMMGRVLREFDGPFAMSQSFETIFEFGLTYGYYERLIETIRNITPIEIQNLARQYLSPGSMTQVIAGKV